MNYQLILVTVERMKALFFLDTDSIISVVESPLYKKVQLSHIEEKIMPKIKSSRRISSPAELGIRSGMY